MPLFKCLDSLLIVLVQIANEMGLPKKFSKYVYVDVEFKWLQSAWTLSIVRNSKYKVFKKGPYNGIPNVAVWRVLRKRLHLKAYSVCFAALQQLKTVCMSSK
jgi:hypothetical protein